MFDYVCKFPLVSNYSSLTGWENSRGSECVVCYDFETNKYSITQERFDKRPVFNPDCNSILSVNAFNQKFKLLTGGSLSMQLGDLGDLNVCLERRDAEGLRSYSLMFKPIDVVDYDVLESLLHSGGIRVVHIDWFSNSVGISVSTACAYLVVMNKDFLCDLVFLCCGSENYKRFKLKR